MQNAIPSNTQDSNRLIFQSAARFFTGTMLSRITGMVRDIAMAYAFGTQSTIAALLVAFRFAHLLRRLLGEGAMQTALIPHFEELRKESAYRAGRFFCDLTVSLTFLLTAITFFVMISLGCLLKWGELNPGNQEIAWLTFIMMPSLPLICLFGINTSLMQCEKRFFSSSAAPISFNLLWILGIFCSYHFPIDQAVTLLSFFIIAACFAQWATTLPTVYSILRKFEIKRLWRSGTYYSKDVLSLAKPLALGIIGVGASQINNALDAVFARWTDQEGPAILWYAIRLQQLPLALFGIAIASALLPPLARAAKTQDYAQLQNFLSFATQRTLLFMLPITVALLLLGDACIRLVYGHGDFANSSIIGTTLSLWGYTFGLIPMALVLILAPAFYAQGDYHTPSKAAVRAMILNVLLNTFMIAFLGLGTGSVALATSISAWANLGFLGIALNKKTQWISKKLLIATEKLLIATILASIAVLAMNFSLWGTLPVWDMFQNKDVVYPLSFLDQVMHLGISSAIFFLVFMGSAFAFQEVQKYVFTEEH